MEQFMWLLLAILLIFFFILKYYFFKPGAAETASGAIVMALGIFMNGAAYRLPANEAWGKIYAVGLLAVWLFIAASFVKTAYRRELKVRHFADPVQSFAVGTWVAGTSVCGVVIAKRLPDWQWLVQGMAAIAVFLWLYYLAKSIANFRTILREGLYRKAHGVILLSTVSTQSLAILGRTLYADVLPNGVYAGMIVLGTVFYVSGFYLIAKRYVLTRSLNLADEWSNTNCIIHGAMSITGLACAVTGAVTPNLTLIVWIWVLLWFVVVETVEIVRAVQRIRRYGIARGIGIYYVSQWSRNFTFGMLYAFTLFFDLSKLSLAADSVLYSVKSIILVYGAWVVPALLLNEILLFLKEKLAIGVHLHFLARLRIIQKDLKRKAS